MNYSVYIGLKALESHGIAQAVIYRCIKPFLHYPMTYSKEFGGLLWKGKFTRGRIPAIFETTIAYVQNDREMGYFFINDFQVYSPYLLDQCWNVSVYCRVYLEDEKKEQIQDELNYILNYAHEKNHYIGTLTIINNKRLKTS